jgi:hypothetical protein
MEPHASSSQLPPPPPGSPLPTATKFNPNTTNQTPLVTTQDPADKKRKDGGALKTGKGAVQESRQATKDSRAFSYRDAVVRPRTFKPRFPPASSHQAKLPWLCEDRWKKWSREDMSVWSRLGATNAATPSILDRLGAGGSEGNHFLALLKAKAGARRCFNCLASDHRISQCRDPPRCLICSRSGHKARSCPRRRALAATAPMSAPAAFAPPAWQAADPSALQRRREGAARWMDT